MPELTPEKIERLALLGEITAIGDLCADRWLAGEHADPHLLRRQRIVGTRLLALLQQQEALTDR